MSLGTYASALRGFLRVVPLGLAVGCLVATVFVSDMLVQRERFQVRAHTEAEAKHVAAELKAGLLQAFDPLPRIAAWWLLQGRPLAPEDWETDAQLFVSARAGLQTVVWVEPNGNRSWSVRPGTQPDTPLETPDSALKESIAAARHSDSMVLSRVFELRGKAALYACTPVKRGGRLVSYIAGLYDAAELVRSVLEDQLPDGYFVVVTADGREVRLPAGSASTKGATGRTARITLLNTTWAVTAFPSASGVTTLQQAVVTFGVLISTLLYGCAAIARISRRRAGELASVNTRLVFENQERCWAEERLAQLNRDLQRRVNELQTLFEVLPIGIAVAEDADCHKIWANRSLAEMLKVPFGQNISKSAPDPHEAAYTMRHNGVEVPAAQLPMQVAARTKRAVENQELEILRRDGSVIHTLSYAAPLFDESQMVRGVINACVDITERRSLEQRLQRAEKYRSLALMAGGIAHDFNNLLTVIMGHASLALAGAPEKSPLGRALGDLQAAANRAAELVSQLLVFTGQFWCAALPVNLSTEVESMKPSIRDVVPPSTAVRYELAHDLPAIQAGVPELQQVIQNLVTNAAESLNPDEPGTIEIRTSQCELSASDIELFFPDQNLTAGRYARLEVTDSGCGIPQEITVRVFDPFFTTKFVGRGLGLSAVQGIMRAHEGGVRLESSLHHGTRVEVVLPLCTPQAAPDPVRARNGVS